MNQEKGIENFNFKNLAKRRWKDVLDRFSQDMDPWDIDIVRLADRYKSYISKLETYNLEIPARLILIASVLLRMKSERLMVEEGEEDEPKEEMIEEEMEPVEQEPVEDSEPDDYFIPDLEFPVKKKARRRITIEELKEALSKALDINKKRKKRRKTRKKNRDYGVELSENDIHERMESLFNRLKETINEEEEGVEFNSMFDKNDNLEKVERFIQLLYLENEDKVRCNQPEFLGDLFVKLPEGEKNGGTGQESNN